MLKNFILKIGRILIDFAACVDFLLLFVGLIGSTFFIFASELELGQKIGAVCVAVLIILLLFIVSVIAKYLIYLFIDIRDNINKITNKDENIKDNSLIGKIFIGILSCVLSAIILGCFVSFYIQYDKKIMNDDNNFRVKEIEKTIKYQYLYSDEVKSSRFGFIYNKTKNEFVITDVIPNSPADKAGLIKGDKVIKVNAIDTKDVDKKKWEKISSCLRKNIITLKYQRNNVEKIVKIKKEKITAPNIAPNIPLALYQNSMGFKDDYIYAYFKVLKNNSNQNTYTKLASIFNCDKNNKTIITFWKADFVDGELIQEYNYLKNKSIYEESVKPQTYGEAMWKTACYINENQSQAEKKDYMRNKYKN